MTLKTHAFVGDLAQFRKGKDLIPARIGQYGAVPLHEMMEPAEVIEHVCAWPQVEMVGVAEDDAAVQRGVGEFARMDRLDRAASPHRHESRGLDHAMREDHAPASGGSLSIGFQQGEHGGGDR